MSENSITRFLNSLKLFNEKALKLTNCSFTKNVFGQKTGVKICAERGKPVEVIRFGPDQEAIDAFVLTFRFFIQDNEKSSFRNLAKIYKKLSIPEAKKRQFSEARNALNEFLDSTPPIQFNILGETLTNRRILEVFIYGGLAHANPEKKRIYDQWISISPLQPLLINQFIVILAKVLNIILYVAKLNAEVIGELEKADHKSESERVKLQKVIDRR